MRLASLFSGGKDSLFAIHKAKSAGHQVDCLITLFPNSNESHLLHHPNLVWTKLQSESMKIPQLTSHLKSDDVDEEISHIIDLLKIAKTNYKIDGIVHGGISSNFQKQKFENICSELDLIAFGPLWRSSPNEYMNNLLDSKFTFIITSVTSDGLDEKWLGIPVTKSHLDDLEKLSVKFGFNLNFEGGEAETFVIDCPLFSRPIKINKNKKFWDGYRGRFEIVDAELNSDA